VADEELGESVVVDECLGTDEHVYKTAETDGVDSKHYLATAYRCHFERDDPEIVGDDQHSAVKIFRPPFKKLHPYVQRYLDEW
jgi:colanic acid biosynthesis protein WcaH